jgi:signal transduction histidine kinase
MTVAAVLAALAVLGGIAVGWHSARLRARDRLREAEEEVASLRRQVDARAALNREVAHDMRAAIEAADARVETIQRGIAAGPAVDQRRLLGGVRRAHASVLAAIDDLLELWSVDADDPEFTNVFTDLRTIIDQATEFCRGSALAAGHALHVDVPRRPLPVLIDRQRVLRVVANLVSGALEDMPSPGHAHVSAGVREDGDAPAPGRWITVSVVASGGAADDDGERTCDGCGPADAGSAPAQNLRLGVSRRIARLLGGDVTVAEAEPGGAEVTLWLPFAGQGANR